MNRIETELALHRDRVRGLEAYASLTPAELVGPATRSELDPDSWWTPKDHFSHLLRVERYFNQIIVAFLDGAADPIAATGRSLTGTREDVIAEVNRVNEEWMLQFREVPFVELVRRKQAARSETLALVARIDDAEFDVQMPGVPWSGGTIAGVLTHNEGNHFDRHWRWVTEGLTANGSIGSSIRPSP